LGANHWISFQIEVPPMPESKMPIGSLLSIKTKLGSLVYISKYFSKKTAQSLILMSGFIYTSLYLLET
jgi:hypothetical protein